MRKHTEPPNGDDHVPLGEMRWRSRFEIAIQNERDTIRIGVGALQTAVLMNAGALVAILAFVGQVWDKDQGGHVVSRVLGATIPFMWGLVSAALAFVFAYFYQWATTRRAYHALEELTSEKPKPLSYQVTVLQWCARIAMILLTLWSYGAFIWSTFAVLDAFTE